MNPRILLAALLTIVGLATESALGDSGASPRIDFVRDIQPIFATKCNACHGPDEQEGQLRLDARTSVKKGGVSGVLYEVGEANESLLYRMIAGIGDVERMPLDDHPLTAEQIELISRWIDEGAQWPDGVGADVSAETHWAYVLPKRPTLPTVMHREWLRSPLDAFVLRKLERRGLSPSPRADEAKLLRRVYLDLIGLPPSVEAIEEFESSRHPDKYERVVNELLASPQYGARWARPWLDAARYADSNGYQADQYRSVWPYRDYVINAMNADMPFDQFTREQIAGDLLPKATVAQRIATGFHRLTTCNVEAGVDPEENRVNQIIDRVNTTGTVWLGTSLECAQCHNHKYDPFTQKDYYQIFAYFNNTPLEVEGNGVTYNFIGPKMELPLSDQQAAEKATLVAERQAIDKRLELAAMKRLAGLAAWEKQMTAGKPANWHVLKVESFESSGGSSHTILDDKSVLVCGKKPEQDTYTVVCNTQVQDITGFKLEALTDPSLPSNGPGRYTRANFVLYDFSITTKDLGSSGEAAARIALHRASADFSQAKWDVAGLIDDDPNTGWAIAPQFGKPHHATLLTDKPIGSASGTTLTFTLDQHYGECRTIGRLRLSAMTGTPAATGLPDAVAKALATPTTGRDKEAHKVLQEYFVELDPQVKKFRELADALQKKIDAIQPVTSLVMIEDKEQRTTTVFKRGNFLDKAEPVAMATPDMLPKLRTGDAKDRRELARWLASKENPLTARVAVNRWWAEIFGRGIVETIEDFGTQGDKPTHPKLLDWLAIELMESGWSMKHVHKQIVLSAAYQQSSKVSPELLEMDTFNTYYSRGPRFRLPAETVRDNALTISGLLSRNMAGPPIFPPQPPNIWRHVGRNGPKYDTSQGNDRFRRGIYVIWRRSAPYPSFTNFDAPDRASCVVKRPRTNTPLQALTLMNDPAYVEMAIAFAEHIAEQNMSLDESITFAFRSCVARQPRMKDIQLLSEVYQSERQHYEDATDDAVALVGKQTERRTNVQDLAAWFHVANILLNLDETITKN
ncbi:MAG: hypothetical protein CMJ64_16445 [Planctomycetaceae bacterium]|nr:hypothetical protein [Planctomycetaceae bacterium]